MSTLVYVFVSVAPIDHRRSRTFRPRPDFSVILATTAPPVPLGIGIYSRPDAARLLGMTPDRLRRWVGGYTYHLRQTSDNGRSRRRQAPVVRTELPVVGNIMALSFLELMELRVVKALVDRDVTLQQVRRAAQVAAERFNTKHPFASRRVFTDGRHIFSAVSDAAEAPDVVKWTAAEIDQVVAGPVFDQFLSEIEFDSATSLASRWWPLGRQVPVILDPAIRFGAPVVAGTGVRTSTLARLARTTSVRDVAVAYELELAQAHAAINFEQQLSTA